MDCLLYLFHRLIMSLFIYTISVELNATKWICNKKSNLFHYKVPGISSLYSEKRGAPREIIFTCFKTPSSPSQKRDLLHETGFARYFFFFFSLPTLLTIEYSSFASLFIFNDGLVSFDFKLNIEYTPRVSRKHTKIWGPRFDANYVIVKTWSHMNGTLLISIIGAWLSCDSWWVLTCICLCFDLFLLYHHDINWGVTGRKLK